MKKYFLLFILLSLFSSCQEDVKEETIKVKVFVDTKISFFTTEMEHTLSWIQEQFFIEEEKTIYITLDRETIVVANEPI